MKVSTVCLAAVANAIPDPFWPGQNAYKGLNCGFVETLEMSSNKTCTITMPKGAAAYVNAGGAFITGPSGSNNRFFVHSYDGHGEANTGAVRFQVFSEMTQVYYMPGSRWNSKYPAVWNDECYNQDDYDAGLPAAEIECIDNEGEVEGVFMMGFGTDLGT